MTQLEDNYLTTDEAAQLLGVNPRTLMRWHNLGFGPPKIKMGLRSVRYAQSSLEKWLRSQEASPCRET